VTLRPTTCSYVLWLRNHRRRIGTRAATVDVREARCPRLGVASFAGRGHRRRTTLQRRVVLVVDRSTTGLISGGFAGRSVDGRPAQETHQDTVDDLNHLAKVRVAGSNLVFRS
jgi:hypothetical protein